MNSSHSAPPSSRSCVMSMLPASIEPCERWELSEEMRIISLRRWLCQLYRHSLTACEVPLERLIGYADALRSLTQGEASLAMEFSHYAPLDAFAQQQLLLELRGY